MYTINNKSHERECCTLQLVYKVQLLRLSISPLVYSVAHDFSGHRTLGDRHKDVLYIHFRRRKQKRRDTIYIRITIPKQIVIALRVLLPLQEYSILSLAGCEYCTVYRWISITEGDKSFHLFLFCLLLALIGQQCYYYYYCSFFRERRY